MDGISLYAIRHELARYLPMKVQKIYHLSDKELLFMLWSKHLKANLVLSLENGLPFFGIIGDKPQAPEVPSGVCLGLRKRLEGGILNQIRQEGLDRVLYFDFSGYDDFRNREDYTLVFDAAGRSGGFGLIRNEVVEFSIPQGRQRFDLGKPYAPPHSSKSNLLIEDDLPGLAAKICSAQQPAYKSIISQIEGVGKDLALSIVVSTELSAGELLSMDNVEGLAKSLEAIQSRLVFGQFSPALYLRESGEPLFSALPLYHLEPVKTFARLFEGVSSYREYLLYFRRYTALDSQVKSLYKKVRNKVVTKFNAQKQDFENASEFEKYRIWAELIHSTGEYLHRGHHEIKALDYYQDPPVEVIIPLDPRFTSGENASRYYAKYAKLQRAKQVLESSLRRAQVHINRLDRLQERLGQENDINSLISMQNQIMKIARQSNIRISGRNRKTARVAAKGKKVKKVSDKPVQIIKGPADAVLYVGKSAQGNDYLVRHLRKQGDIWFHARGVKGAHVLLRLPAGTAVTGEIVNWAATVAAQHSEAAASGKVELEWIDAAAIQKPGGSPPGFVTYTGAKTILVKLN